MTLYEAYDWNRVITSRFHTAALTCIEIHYYQHKVSVHCTSDVSLYVLLRIIYGSKIIKRERDKKKKPEERNEKIAAILLE